MKICNELCLINRCCMLVGQIILCLQILKFIFKGQFINIRETFFILDSPRTSVFLEELNEAVRPLQDYGISVAKVERYLCY